MAYIEEGTAGEDVFEYVKSIPTELEELYVQMLDRMGKKSSDLRNGIRRFYFVLFTLRPLAVDELLHALAIPDGLKNFTPSDDYFQKRAPVERRSIHCGGNFIEIQRDPGFTLHKASLNFLASKTFREL